MSKIVNIQHEILVLGIINGTSPKNTAELNGIAYLGIKKEKLLAYY